MIRSDAYRIVLIGPPGAGKGTQATRIATALRVPAISTGELFRGELAAGTELARRIRVFVDAGELVPDELVVDVVAARLHQDDARQGFVLDGFPRTSTQARILDALLGEREAPIQRALLLAVDRETVIERLARRAVLESRVDDTPQVIARRLDIYETEAADLAAHYGEQGLLEHVDAAGSLGAVYDRMVNALQRPRDASVVA